MIVCLNRRDRLVGQLVVIRARRNRPASCVRSGGRGFACLRGDRSNQGVVAASFSPFSLLLMMVDPERYAGASFSGADAATARVFVFVFTLIAVGVYATVVWTMYKSMVKNFDMTIRRQSR